MDARYYLDTHKVLLVVENDEDGFLTDAFGLKSEMQTERDGADEGSRGRVP